ncbi:hypothetical protein MNBD_GAMMA11-2927 [hydrothermal vent metagenome]|uniref:Uncharacterized protein n=1 Tax=hydrothermal vent metagenome TaxID=652676 RepID=A0A3B0WX97_9ZZZZ
MKLTEYTRVKSHVTLHLVRLGYEYLSLKNVTKNIEKLVKFRNWCPLMLISGRVIVKAYQKRGKNEDCLF